jgi:hypothetical protein
MWQVLAKSFRGIRFRGFRVDGLRERYYDNLKYLHAYGRDDEKGKK